MTLGSSTRSCCRTIGIIPSTYGAGCSCCTLSCRTSSFRGTSPVHGRGTSASVRDFPIEWHSDRKPTADVRSTGHDQTLLQNLLLPVFVVPTLLPTPLLEPRYFLIPYILLRAQVKDVPVWGLAVEGLWYAAINGVTMWVFLYKERPGVGRFMW